MKPFKQVLTLLLFSLLSLTFITDSQSASTRIPTINRNKVSDMDMTPIARAALSLYGKEWKHAETEHFVYHFLDEQKAKLVYLKSEHYYQWVKNFFGIKQDKWKKKSHIFIFSETDQWEAFRKRINYKIAHAAFTNGWELYLGPYPLLYARKGTLAHELTHVIAFRFLEGPIPLFLNEGFAEYASVRALAVQFKGNEFKVRRLLKIPKEDFIDLDTLITTIRYPSNLRIFYNESQFLVKHLIITYGREKFYKLVLEVSRGKDFKKTCEKIYRTNFKTIQKEFENAAILKK